MRPSLQIGAVAVVGALLLTPVVRAGEKEALSPEVRVSGLETPESVLYDPDADVYLVSNIVGSPLEKDGKGFISRLSPEGKVVALKWIDSGKNGVTLNAPKGLAIAGGRLYVADIDTVRAFDIKTGAPKGDFSVAGALFLNDVAPAPGGGVYVSDSGLEAAPSGLKPTGHAGVYRVTADGQVKTVIAGTAMPAFNGVAVYDGRVFTVPFDADTLLEIVDGKLVTRARLPKGGLDGLVRLPDGRWAASSWEGKAIYAGPLTGPFVPVVENVTSPADIGLDTKRHRFLIPIFTGNEVVIRSVPKE